MARTAVIVGTATAVSGRVARRQEERHTEGAEASQTPASPPEASPEPAPTAGPTPEGIEELKQLGVLKDQGILTEEELAAEKAKILGE